MHSGRLDIFGAISSRQTLEKCSERLPVHRFGDVIEDEEVSRAQVRADVQGVSRGARGKVIAQLVPGRRTEKLIFRHVHAGILKI